MPERAARVLGPGEPVRARRGPEPVEPALRHRVQAPAARVGRQARELGGPQAQGLEPRVRDRREREAAVPGQRLVARETAAAVLHPVRVQPGRRAQLPPRDRRRPRERLPGLRLRLHPR